MVKLQNTSKNKFWETLEKNIKDMLRETDKLLPEGSSETFTQTRSQGVTASNRPQTASQRRAAGQSSQTTTTGPGVAEQVGAQEGATQTLTFREAASVIMNAETGTIAIRATGRQHEIVGEFIEQIGGSSRRQVLIEATVVEVVLNDAYQSGVDWAALGLQGLGYTIKQNLTGTLNTNPLAAQAPTFSISYRNPNAAAGGDISSTLKLLNSFGNARVLSSPKIMTLNNQTAVMRVVENTVYFTITTTPGTLNDAGRPITLPTVDSKAQVVPQGFVMSVTPQISENDIINLSVRPSVTRITKYVQDPNPTLSLTVPNLVPQIETREFEAMMRVASGQTAVLGGLMQDEFKSSRAGVPILSRIPFFGDAVSKRDDAGRKSELVVFIRALVIREASVDADLSDYKKYLPDASFFKDSSPSFDLKNPGSINAGSAVPEGEPRKAP